MNQVRTHLHLLGGSTDQQIAYVATLLTGAAQLWWQRYLKQHGGPPLTVEELEYALIKRFGNSSKEQTAMASLLHIKQHDNESVHAYALRFEQALDQVSSFDEQWIKNIFIWGLQSNIATQVALARTRSLDATIQTALQVDQALKFSRKPTSTAAGRGGNRGRGSRGRWSATEATGRGGSGTSGSSGGRGQGTTATTTTQTRAQLKCTYCGQVGHTQNTCWTKNPSL